MSEYCERILFIDRERYPGTNPPKSERCRELLKARLLRKQLWFFDLNHVKNTLVNKFD